MTKRPLGRPRDGRVDRELRKAVAELLPELGYANLTVDAVAARAKVGKAAIYRRYGSKTELVFAAMFENFMLIHPADSGSLTGDLTAAITDLLASFTQPLAAAAVPGLLADLVAHPEIAERVKTTFLPSDVEYFKTLLARAMARGEIAHAPDVDLIYAMPLGTVFAWLFLVQWPLPPDLPQRIAQFMAQGLTAKPEARPKKRSAKRRSAGRPG